MTGLQLLMRQEKGVNIGPCTSDRTKFTRLTQSRDLEHDDRKARKGILLSQLVEQK